MLKELLKAAMIPLSLIALLLAASADLGATGLTQWEYEQSVIEQHGVNGLTLIILSKPIDRPAWFRRATEKSGCIHDGAVYDLQNCWNLL